MDNRTIKIDALRELDIQLRRKNETYTIFKFKKNSVEFDVFFDIGTVPYNLGFLLLKSNFQFWIDVVNGYLVNYILDTPTYYKLCDILELKNSDPNNKFSPFKFFSEFNGKIPKTLPIITQKQRHSIIPKVFSNIEEAEKIYYYKMIDWDNTTVKKKRSAENLEKTRYYYPELYERIKDKNITVQYTHIEDNENCY